MTKRSQTIQGMICACIFVVVAAGCTSPATPPAAGPTPTVVPGWERVSNTGQCGYVIDHPSDMEVTSQGAHSSLISVTPADPDAPAPNFIYISVIPDDFQIGGDEIIYNYDPAEAQNLLNMQVGESRSLRDLDPNLAAWFTYTRLSDRTFGGLAAQAYENEQPWEFPPSTKEIRYYLQADGCTYLLGGYLATVGSGQPGAIGEELFEQIIATFRLAL